MSSSSTVYKKTSTMTDFINKHLGRKTIKFEIINIISYTDKQTKESKTAVTLYFKENHTFIKANDSIINFVVENKLNKGDKIIIFHIRSDYMKQEKKQFYRFDILFMPEGNKKPIIKTNGFYKLHDLLYLLQLNDHEVIHYYKTVKVNKFNPDFDNTKLESKNNKKFIEEDKTVVFMTNYNTYLLDDDDKITDTIMPLLEKHNIKPKQETKLVLCTCNSDKCELKTFYKEKDGYIIEKIVKDEQSDSEDDFNIDNYV